MLVINILARVTVSEVALDSEGEPNASSKPSSAAPLNKRALTALDVRLSHGGAGHLLSP